MARDHATLAVAQRKQATDLHLRSELACGPAHPAGRITPPLDFVEAGSFTRIRTTTAATSLGLGPSTRISSRGSCRELASRKGCSSSSAPSLTSLARRPRMSSPICFCTSPRPLFPGGTVASTAHARPLVPSWRDRRRLPAHVAPSRLCLIVATISSNITAARMTPSTRDKTSTLLPRRGSAKFTSGP